MTSDEILRSGDRAPALWNPGRRRAGGEVICLPPTNAGGLHATDRPLGRREMHVAGRSADLTLLADMATSSQALGQPREPSSSRSKAPRRNGHVHWQSNWCDSGCARELARLVFRLLFQLCESAASIPGQWSASTDGTSLSHWGGPPNYHRGARLIFWSPRAAKHGRRPSRFGIGRRARPPSNPTSAGGHQGGGFAREGAIRARRVGPGTAYHRPHPICMKPTPKRTSSPIRP